MTEEKKSQIRKKVSLIEIAMAAVLIGYLVYGLAVKNTNTTVFHILAVVIMIGFVVLNDFVEPYLTKTFENMDTFRKDAYKSYLMWDLASKAGLLFFVLTFTVSGSIMIYLGLVLYFIGTKQKRSFQSAFWGDVTKEEVEAAKSEETEE